MENMGLDRIVILPNIGIVPANVLCGTGCCCCGMGACGGIVTGLGKLRDKMIKEDILGIVIGPRSFSMVLRIKVDGVFGGEVVNGLEEGGVVDGATGLGVTWFAHPLHGTVDIAPQ
jgi:hypothetical protein